MSVAALEAVALQDCLARGGNRLGLRYLKACRKIVNVACDLAVGSDLTLPEIPGKRSLVIRIGNAWSELVFEVAERDAYVAEVFGSATDLLAPPAVLLHPRFAWRVVRCRLRRSGTTRASVHRPEGDSSGNLSLAWTVTDAAEALEEPSRGA
jgi:hypothetical protein